MISCDLHDYIEIAVMFSLQIKVTLVNGDSVDGQAVNLGLDESRNEYLGLQDQGIAHNIRLDDIKAMRALQENLHFDEVVFKQ
jgi:Rho-binding antiterminator